MSLVPETRVCLTAGHPGCEGDAMPGDHVCRNCARYFRAGHRTHDYCRNCGRKLVGPFALQRGECLDCDERAADAFAMRQRWRKKENAKRRAPDVPKPFHGPFDGGTTE